MKKKSLLLILPVLMTLSFAFATRTGWMDKDNTSGAGDYELFTGPCVGIGSGILTIVEVNVVGSTGASFFFSGNVYNGTLFGQYGHIYGPLRTGSADRGPWCKNTENTGGCINDYKVRFNCI